ARSITGGDLSQRVARADEGTEVGRLGLALNTMLERIEESDQRLRRFVADASHELRTPLAAVRVYAELFERGASARPDDLKRSMEGIVRETARTVDPARPVELEAESVVVSGDATRLRQVLDNLLANVRAHTPAGTAAH